MFGLMVALEHKQMLEQPQGPTPPEVESGSESDDSIDCLDDLLEEVPASGQSAK